MKFTIDEIANQIPFSDYGDSDLYPGYSNEIEDDNYYRFNSKEEFENYAKQIIGLFDSFPKEFPIYRSISVKSEKDIRMDYLGESWSFDLESAKQFGSHNGSNYILSAIVDDENVDWQQSMIRYLSFTTGDDSDDENEIVVINTDELKNVTISKLKEAKEIGENPIFTRTYESTYVKSFENWLVENKNSHYLFR